MTDVCIALLAGFSIPLLAAAIYLPKYGLIDLLNGKWGREDWYE